MEKHVCRHTWDANINRDVNIKGGGNIKKDVNIKRDINIKGDVNIRRDVNIKGDGNIKGDVNIRWDVNIKGDVNIRGDVNRLYVYNFYCTFVCLKRDWATTRDKKTYFTLKSNLADPTPSQPWNLFPLILMATQGPVS